MPNDYDKIIKENFDELFPYLLRVTLGLHLPKLVNLKDKLQVTLERELDNLKLAVHDDPSLNYGLHWEIQSTDEDMRARNLLYYALFYQKHRLPLKQIVIYLGDLTPQKILENCLELEGLSLTFEVVNLKSIHKDVFLHSGTPEGVLLAILADFGADKPQKVVRQILEHLLRLVGRHPELKKYQKQLHVLSRLRKLSTITKKELEAMPIHYEIETDELYLEGIEKGIEKGIELAHVEVVKRMLMQRKYTLHEIVLISGVDVAIIREIAQHLGVEVS